MNRYLVPIIALFLLGSLSMGCNRWRDNTPVGIAGDAAQPHLAFEAALSALRLKGYQLEGVDPARGYIRARAKLNEGSYSYGWGKIENKTSYLHLQGHTDGNVTLTATGYLVHDDGRTIHKNLQREMQELSTVIQAEVARMRAQGIPAAADYSANATPMTPPPPPPPPPPAPPFFPR